MREEVRTELDAGALDQLFRAARTHSAWLERPVTDDQLRRIYDLMKWGPTSANSSPARIVFLRSRAAKERLAPALAPQNVDKTLQAPVTAIVAHDLRFYDELPRLFPHVDARSWFVGNEPLVDATAFRNGSLQGAYLILAARALGLDAGPMSGFDNEKVDREFFPDRQLRSRFLTHDLQRRLDPFLLLDAFGSDDPKEYIAGFPDHPHRGFETVTYMLAGRIRHRDSAGHEGVVSAGGVQWMTAARGVVHSEMPEQENGLMQGFQLWLNLPARDKMSAPTYRDIPAAEIPTFTDEGVRVKVIAGEVRGMAGAVSKPVTEPVILDIELPADRRWAASLPTKHTAFVYVYEGVVRVGDRAIPLAAGRMGILTTDPAADGVVLGAAEPSRVLLLAGAPLREPIVQYGPFVMNNRAEIRQAIDDAAAGHLGAIPPRNLGAREEIQ